MSEIEKKIEANRQESRLSKQHSPNNANFFLKESNLDKFAHFHDRSGAKHPNTMRQCSDACINAALVLF